MSALSPTLGAMSDTESYHHTPYPARGRRESIPGYERFFQHQTLVHVVHGVTIGYRLTLTGVPDIETMPSTRDESLPEYSIRVTLGDHEVVLTVDEWGGRGEELDTWLRDWIVERVSWTRAGVASGCRHRDPGWMRVLRERGPWR